MWLKLLATLCLCMLRISPYHTAEIKSKDTIFYGAANCCASVLFFFYKCIDVWYKCVTVKWFLFASFGLRQNKNVVRNCIYALMRKPKWKDPKRLKQRIKMNKSQLIRSQVFSFCLWSQYVFRLFPRNAVKFYAKIDGQLSLANWHRFLLVHASSHLNQSNCVLMCMWYARWH